MLPLDMAADFGKIIGYITFFLVGAGFGSVLEMGGFGDSRKLAAQFYFRDMTVLKVMFTGIIVACLLIFLTSSIGLLDFSKIFVNQTYLWPGIVGGLIMGVGFIVGGYCPGTSIVSAASLKLDGITFFIGTIIGVGIFGESVTSITTFWNSSFTERLLVSDWLGWSVGATVVAVVLLALAMFYAAEKSEEYFKLKSPADKISWLPTNKLYIGAGTLILLIALLIWAVGQPTPEKKWASLHAKYQPQLDSREVFIHPLEYVKSWNDSSIKLVTLDFRSSTEFENFHLSSAKLATLNDLENKDFIYQLMQLPPQGLVVIVAENDDVASKAWKWLKVQGIGNLYILDGGIQNWNQLFKGLVLPHGNLDLTRPSLKIFDLFPKDSYKEKIKLKTGKKGGGLCS
jgi:rhodanese-related sulfurtransferase